MKLSKEKKEELKEPEASESESQPKEELSLEPDIPEPEQPKEKKKKEIKEKIEKAQAKDKKKKDKKEMIAIRPDAFANFSVGIERITLQVHKKNKELSEAEEMLIRTSAEQVAEVYEVPKIIVLVQYGVAMVLPHINRILVAQAEKMEIQNEKAKLELEEKKKQIKEMEAKAYPNSSETKTEAEDGRSDNED